SRLPTSVNFIAESPILHVVGIRVPVLLALISPVSVRRGVAVFHPVRCVLHRPRAHVYADIWFGAKLAAVFDELVGAETVRLFFLPGGIPAARPRIFRPDSVFPIVSG